MKCFKRVTYCLARRRWELDTPKTISSLYLSAFGVVKMTQSRKTIIISGCTPFLIEAMCIASITFYDMCCMQTYRAQTFTSNRIYYKCYKHLHPIAYTNIIFNTQICLQEPMLDLYLGTFLFLFNKIGWIYSYEYAILLNNIGLNLLG